MDHIDQVSTTLKEQQLLDEIAQITDTDFNQTVDEAEADSLFDINTNLSF